MRRLMICTPHRILCGYRIEKNEMGGSCSAYGNGRSVYGILVWKPEIKSPLGKIRRNGNIILRWIYVVYTRWNDKIYDESSGSGVWRYGLDWAEIRYC